MSFLTVVFFFGGFILLSKLVGMKYRVSINTKLRLRGLKPESGFELDNCPIQATLETIAKAELDNEAHLVSRLQWWQQINRYLDMLADTPESISSVATAIEVLLTYHQLQRAEVEEDLVRALFQRALQNSKLSHLYAKLLKQMTDDTKDWTQELTTRMFQLAVVEFNRPFTQVDDFEKKLNNVKFMAAIFRRRIDGVPDEWMTDCSNIMVQRLHAGLEQSTEQLCLFLKTLLINECNDNCNLSESQKLELAACFEALQKAALCPKEKQSLFRSEAVPTTDVHRVLPEAEPAAEAEEQVEEEFETPPETPSETDKSGEVEEIKTNQADLEQKIVEASSTAESQNSNHDETLRPNPLDQLINFGCQLFQGPSVEPDVPKEKISRPPSPTLSKTSADLKNMQKVDDLKPRPFKARPVLASHYNEPFRPTLSMKRDRPIVKRIPVSKKPITVPEMEPSVVDDKKLEDTENQSEQNVQQSEFEKGSLRIQNNNVLAMADDSDNSSNPDFFDITRIEDKAQVQKNQPKIQPAHKNVEVSLLPADNVEVPKRETRSIKRPHSDSELSVHHGKHWYDDPGEIVTPPGLTSNDVMEVRKTVLLADKTMVDDAKLAVGLGEEKNPEVKGNSIKKKDTWGSDVIDDHQKIHRRQTRTAKWIFPSSRI